MKDIKIIRYLYIMLFIVLLFSTSCKKEPGKNPSEADTVFSKENQFTGEYQEGNDWQYFMTSNYYPNMMIQEINGGSGCVFVHNSFIYRYDQGGEIMPLCSRTNCLHDLETDETKRAECCAYLDQALDEDVNSVSLMVYGDDLYVCYDQKLMGVNTMEPTVAVVKIALDGSSQDIVAAHKSINYPVIHRGCLYYFETVWDTEKTEEESDIHVIHSSVAVHKIDVRKKNYQDEIIYQNENAHGHMAFQAYGKYLWFSLIGDFENRDSAVSLLPYTFVFNTETEELKTTDLNGSSLVIYSGKCYRLPFDHHKDDNYKTAFYEADIYGNIGEKVLNEVEQMSAVYSDGRYLYIRKGDGIRDTKEKKEELWRVYDKDFKLVDTFPEIYPDQEVMVDQAIGGEKYQYLRYKDPSSDAWGLKIWDKKEIGSLKGKKGHYIIVTSDGKVIQPDMNVDPGTDVTEESSDTEKITKEAELPDTTLDESARAEYSEITDEDISNYEEYIKTGKKAWLADAYVDMGKVGGIMDGSINLSKEEVSVDIILYPVKAESEGEERIIIGECYQLKTEMEAYYKKGARVHKQKITQVCLNTENPEPVVLVLPEDADEFIGAKAELTFIQKTEHTSWDDKTESFRVPDINSVEYKYGLYAGRLPGSEF